MCGEERKRKGQANVRVEERERERCLSNVKDLQLVL